MLKNREISFLSYLCGEKDIGDLSFDVFRCFGRSSHNILVELTIVMGEERGKELNRSENMYIRSQACEQSNCGGWGYS